MAGGRWFMAYEEKRRVVLLLFGTLIVLTQGSAVAPFIYTLF